MVVYEDTRQQAGKHELKHKWFAAHGIEVVRRKLDFGDYMRDGSNISVDTKKNVDEVAQNVGGKGHDRFRRECERARDNGYALVILVENDEGVREIADLPRWTNGHCRSCGLRVKKACNPRDLHSKCQRHKTMKPTQGPQLAKAMKTMGERYGVRFEFCKPRDSARRICELLGVAYEQDAEGR